MNTRPVMAVLLIAISCLSLMAQADESTAATPPPVVVVIESTGFDTANPAIHSAVLDELCIDALGGQASEQAYCPGHVVSAEGPGTAMPQLSSPTTFLWNGSEHGTAVASVVASTDSSAQLIVIRSLYGDLPAFQWVIANASKYNIAAVVESAGALITIPSYRTYLPCDQLTESIGAARTSLAPAFAQLHSIGIAVVLAAGNDANSQYIAWPACTTNAVSVGALDTAGGLAVYSNVSANLSILAPGTVTAANETIPGDFSTSSQSGTSFAAPYVAAVIAKIHASYPALSPDQELAAMRTTGALVDDTVIKSIPSLDQSALFSYLAAGTAIPSLASTFSAQLASAPASDAAEMKIGVLQTQLAAANVVVASLSKELAALNINQIVSMAVLHRQLTNERALIVRLKKQLRLHKITPVKS